MHYYKFNIKDWSRDTAHLTVEEEGVYRRLLDQYYESEMPIPEQTQPVIRRLRLSGHEQAVSLILGEFFTLTEDGYRHARCDSEIEKYHSKAQANRVNGKAGGRPKKATENPDGFQEEPNRNLNHKPLTINQEPEDQNHCDQQAESREPALRIPYDDLLDSFKLRLPGFPQPRRPLDDDRKKLVRALWVKDPKYGSVDFFDRYFKFVSESEFLSGWKGCGFDWLFKYKNFRKVIEGNYDGGNRDA